MQDKRSANLYLDSCSMYEVRKIKKNKNKTKSTNKTIDTWKSKVLYSEKMNTRLIIFKRYKRMEPRPQSRQLIVEKRIISMETTGDNFFLDTRIKKAVYILADQIWISLAIWRYNTVWETILLLEAWYMNSFMGIVPLGGLQGSAKTCIPIPPTLLVATPTHSCPTAPAMG